MKKETAILGILLTAVVLFSITTVSAETIVQGEANTQGEINSGGGLGKGLNYMVRSILGESNESVVEMQIPVAPHATLMVEADSALQANTRMAPAPEAMMFKASFASDAAIAPLTEADLHTYISALLSSDSNIQSVDTAETHVRITYAVPAKVFGFVPVTLRVTAGAYISGATEVAYPWYGFTMSRAVAEFKTMLAERIEPVIPTTEFTLEDQKMLIDELHVALAAKFGSSTGGDR